MENNRLTLYYSIEKNPNDNYFHSHFLIDCTKDMIELTDINDKLTIICEPNTISESRIYLEEYNVKSQKAGAIYSSKEQKFFYEVLG